MTLFEVSQNWNMYTASAKRQVFQKIINNLSDLTEESEQYDLIEALVELESNDLFGTEGMDIR